MSKLSAFCFRLPSAATPSLEWALFATAVFLSAVPTPRAEEARFFRVAGPVATTITAFSADGYMTWTNALTNATFTVQTAHSLLSQSNWVDYIQVPVTNLATTHRLFDPNPTSGMMLIPAGSFTMGTTFTNEWPAVPGAQDFELPLHSVYVSAFYMDKYDVTKTLWDDVYNWATNHGYSFDFSDSGQGKAATHPVHSVTWYDCVKWCNARSEKEGRVPAYYTNAEQTIAYRVGTNDLQTNFVKWNSGYRLPTEAEWEKAARGGASGHRFPWSDADTINQSRANYYSPWSGGAPVFAYDASATNGYHPTFATGSVPYTSPVGYFAPNGYGLYDMAGDVWEWCWDWYGSYSSSSQTDPRGSASGASRVTRGGGWASFAFFCRAACRNYYDPTGRLIDIGFRSVLPPSQP